jgi:protein TonB
VKFTLINLPKQIEQPKIEKKEIVKKEPIHQPKKVVKKINPKKIAPKKIVKKIEAPIKPTPKIEKIVKKTVEKPIKKTNNQIVANQVKKNKSIIKEKTIQTDTKQLKIKQNQYYTQIKKTIDKNKSYPKVAVRRGIQGDVQIQFTISKTGELLSFKILDGKKVFFKSIQEAVKNSFPLTPPKDIFTSNLDLKLTLQYKLY